MNASDKRCRILVAEDDANLRLLVVELLELTNYRVTAVDGARTAREAFDRECPDLVLADIAMPEGGGFEVLRHIRAHATAADVPVIFLTGHTGLADVRAGLREGVDDYLTKPFDPEELLRAIAMRLKRREQQWRQLAEVNQAMGTTVPHDLRNPLTGIMGYAQLLQEKAKTSEPVAAVDVSEAADAQIAACERLIWLGDALQIWAELSAPSPELLRKYALARTAGWVPEATARCEELAQAYGRARQYTLELEDAVLPVPERHWLMAVAQLVDNAFKYSPAGSMVWVIGKREKDAYRLSVWNEGRCRSEYAVVDPAAKRAADEVALASDRRRGLGLPIVCRLAALAGAEFRLGSFNDGTEAFLVLPGADRAGEPGVEAVPFG